MAANYRKKYEEAFGPLAEGLEIHHRIPVRLGGNDDLSNLTPVSREEHAVAHRMLYEKFGDKKDLCAYYMLSGDIAMGRKVAAAIGGRIGGAVLKRHGRGIFRDEDERLVWASMGGSAAQKTIREKQLTSFYDPVLRNRACSNGGKNGAFTQTKWQAEFGKRGGVKNRGKRWITDGSTTKKINAGEDIPLGWRFGRK